MQVKWLLFKMCFEVGCSWLYVDGVCIQQVIWNLVCNVVKFIFEGGVIEVCVWNLLFFIVVVVVKDNGIGIELDVLLCIFLVFEQVDVLII